MSTDRTLEVRKKFGDTSESIGPNPVFSRVWVDLNYQETMTGVQTRALARALSRVGRDRPGLVSGSAFGQSPPPLQTPPPESQHLLRNK